MSLPLLLGVAPGGSPASAPVWTTGVFPDLSVADDFVYDASLGIGIDEGALDPARWTSPGPRTPQALARRGGLLYAPGANNWGSAVWNGGPYVDVAAAVDATYLQPSHQVVLDFVDGNGANAATNGFGFVLRNSAGQILIDVYRSDAGVDTYINTFGSSASAVNGDAIGITRHVTSTPSNTFQMHQRIDGVWSQIIGQTYTQYATALMYVSVRFDFNASSGFETRLDNFRVADITASTSTPKSANETHTQSETSALVSVSFSLTDTFSFTEQPSTVAVEQAVTDAQTQTEQPAVVSQQQAVAASETHTTTEQPSTVAGSAALVDTVTATESSSTQKIQLSSTFASDFSTAGGPIGGAFVAGSPVPAWLPANMYYYVSGAGTIQASGGKLRITDDSVWTGIYVPGVVTTLDTFAMTVDQTTSTETELYFAGTDSSRGVDTLIMGTYLVAGVPTAFAARIVASAWTLYGEVAVTLPVRLQLRRSGGQVFFEYGTPGGTLTSLIPAITEPAYVTAGQPVVNVIATGTETAIIDDLNMAVTASVQKTASDSGTFSENASSIAAAAATETHTQTEQAAALAAATAATETHTQTEQAALAAAEQAAETHTQTEQASTISAAATVTDGSIFTEASAVGQTQAVSASETHTATEPASSIAAALSATDVGSWTETASLAFLLALSATDSWVASEVSALAQTLGVNTTDSGSFMEGTTGLIAGTAATDAGTGTEQASALSASLTAAETHALAELAGSINAALTTAAEVFTFNEVSSLAFVQALAASDAFTATEVATLAMTIALAASDTFGASEVSSLVAALDAIDSATQTEQPSGLLTTLAISATDAQTLSEGLSTIAATIGASDAATQDETSANLGGTTFKAVTDSFSFTETASLTDTTLKTALDAFTIIEAALVASQVALAASETHTQTEQASTIAADEQAAEMHTETEQPSSASVTTSASDSGSHSDTSQPMASFTATDAFTATELASDVQQVVLKAASDTFTVSESTALTIAQSILASETHSLTEVVGIAATLAAEDALTQDEAAILSIAQYLMASDAFGFSEESTLTTADSVHVVAVYVAVAATLVGMHNAAATEGRESVIENNDGTANLVSATATVRID